MAVTLLFQNGQPLLAHGRCSGHSGSVSKMVLGLKGHTSQGGSWEPCRIILCYGAGCRERGGRSRTKSSPSAGERDV